MPEPKYILFAFNYYSPSGGADDCLGIFATLEEAETAYGGNKESAQVAIIQDGKLEVVSRGSSNIHRVPRNPTWVREKLAQSSSV